MHGPGWSPAPAAAPRRLTAGLWNMAARARMAPSPVATLQPSRTCDPAMSLSELTVTNVRCIESAQLQIPPGLSLVWGPNGSGKTSLLEAVFLLGRGRSFRTRNSERLIRRGQDHLRVTGHVVQPSGHTQA